MKIVNYSRHIKSRYDWNAAHTLLKEKVILIDFLWKRLTGTDDSFDSDQFGRAARHEVLEVITRQTQ